jgi:hypothetical protein
MKRPGDDSPEPPGGRAAERLREFLRERRPAGGDLPETGLPDSAPPAADTKQAKKNKPTKARKKSTRRKRR